MGEPLLPCPFCGSGDEMGLCPSETAEGFNVACECGASMYAWKEAAAVRDWNRRTPGPATAAILERARFAKKGFDECDDEFDVCSIPARIGHVVAFLAEWPAPTSPPASPDDTKETPHAGS